MMIKKSNTEARGSVLSREADRARETRTNLLEWRSSAHLRFIRGDLIVWREAPSRNYMTSSLKFCTLLPATQNIKTRHKI